MERSLNHAKKMKHLRSSMERQHRQPRSQPSGTAEDTMERDKPQGMERQTSKIIEEIISREQQRDREILDLLAEQDKKTMALLDELVRKEREMLHKLCDDHEIVAKRG